MLEYLNNVKMGQFSFLKELNVYHASIAPLFHYSDSSCWCRKGDSNPYRNYFPLDPESSASTNSATSAYFIPSIENYNLLFYILGDKVKQLKTGGNRSKGLKTDDITHRRNWALYPALWTL